MKRIRVFAIAILALLTFGVSVSAEVLNRPAYWEFDVAQNLPVLVIKSEKMPNIAAHIKQAQANGKASTLTRITDKAQIDANREAACGRFVRQGNLECDEYPFASTREGGSGASTRGVPPREQRVQGGTMSSFYRYQNIRNGSQFIVRVN